MALILADRVKETCAAPGTGTVSLLGASTGFQAFSSAIGDGNTCYYTISDQGGANWEVGIGTYASSGNTLARTTVLSSSAGGTTKANFSTGTQDVFVTYPAEVAAYSSNSPSTSGYVLTANGAGIAPSWQANANGDVVGPASATDNAVARFDGTTGKIIQNSAVTIADDGATVIAANSTSDGLRITQIGTGNALVVEDSANPDSTPFRISSSGSVLVGGEFVTGLASSGPVFQVTGYGDSSIGANAASMALNGFLPSGNGHQINFNRSNGATVGTNTIVVNGDQLGVIRWGGADGTGYIRAAEIGASVDGTPGTNDMPGRLVFSTTADGASSPTERMRIDSAGQVGIGGAAAAGQTIRINKNFTGATSSFGITIRSSVQSDVTSGATGYQTFISTQAAAFALPFLGHYTAAQSTIGAGSTVTNQFGFRVESSLTGATNNYGFYSAIASGTGRWNFYAAGTAANFLAGPLYIGQNYYTNAGLGVNYNSGSATGIGLYNDTTVAATTTTAYSAFSSYLGTAASAFTLGAISHFVANQSTIGAGSTATNQYGFTANATLTGATNNYGFYGNIAAAANRWNLYMNGTASNYMAGALGIGSTSVSGVSLRIGGNSLGASGNEYNPIYITTAIQSDVTGAANMVYTTPSTAASAFTLTSLRHFYANQGTIGAGSTVTNQYGYMAHSTLTGATNNYGFYSGIASGTGRYNFYAAGTAANYFAGDMQFAKTVTAAGTTGAQTINKTAGTVNFAAAATSLVVTNSLVTANSIIVCTVGTNDTTMKSVSAVAGAGSFTLYANAAATAETRVNFIVIN